MLKEFYVIGSTGNMYTVYFEDDGNKIRGGCNCAAGEKHQICKHLLGVIAENPDIYELLEEYGASRYYDEFLEKTVQVENLKKQAANAKKKFAKILYK